MQENAKERVPSASRHPRFVRITHWLTTLACLALLVSGTEVVLSHPRFYWGEVGNVNTVSLFTIPVPSSRGTVPTRYSYVLPDQNGWSRYMHFQAAWLVLATGFSYLLVGLVSGHIRRDLVPGAADRSWRGLRTTLAEHLRLSPSSIGDGKSYNVLQRVTYLAVVFGLAPLLVWTGLAMSPAFTAVVPASATLLGGRQSARTLHFAGATALVLFTDIHLTMIRRAGFRRSVRAMLGGEAEPSA